MSTIVMPGAEAVLETAGLIRSHVRRTPVVSVEAEPFGVSCGGVTLKLELLRHSGSFQVRGAFVNLAFKTDEPTGKTFLRCNFHTATIQYRTDQESVMARGRVATLPHSRGPGRPKRGWVRKNLQIDQRKLDAARVVLGTKTETDTVDAALDAIAFRRELLQGIRRVRAVGGIRDLYAVDG